MFCYDLLRSHLSRHVERYFRVKPRCDHHSRGFILNVAYGTWDYVAHTVYHSHVEACSALQGDVHSFLRNEFRLGGHDSLACGGLGQFVNGTLLAVVAFNVRYNELLHELFYKGGFSRADRTYHAYIDIAPRPCGNVGVNIVFHVSVLLVH